MNAIRDRLTAHLAQENPGDRPATDSHLTPAKQRIFVTALAITGSIQKASEEAGMSRRAAYDLRMRRGGLAFKTGWDAAILVARAHIVDGLMERCLEGQTDVIANDGLKVTRHKHDNRLSMSMLARLDRMAGHTAVEDGLDAMLAQHAAQDFEAFLDLIGAGGNANKVYDFAAARTGQKIPGQKVAGMRHPEQCEVTLDESGQETLHMGNRAMRRLAKAADRRNQKHGSGNPVGLASACASGP